MISPAKATQMNMNASGHSLRFTPVGPNASASNSVFAINKAFNSGNVTGAAAAPGTTPATDANWDALGEEAMEDRIHRTQYVCR
jgi:hypothetical protein